MRTIFTTTILTAAVAVAVLSRSAPDPVERLEPDAHFSEVARYFAARFPRAHLSRLAIDDVISARAWTNYLASFDYDRAYFTAEDIDTFAERKLLLDDDLKAGQLEFAFDVFHLLRDRVENRVAFIEWLLEQGFDFERNEVYTWKRKDAEWPAREQEWDDLWRRKIKNEVLRRKIAEEMKTTDTNTVDGADWTQRLETVTNLVEAATNALASADDDPGEQAETYVDPDEALGPEEFILKRYRQFLTMLQDTDSEWVLQKFLSAFARAYDPHSDYMSPSDVENFNIEMRLSLVGIGAMLRSEDGAAKIMSILPGGPADKDKRDIRLRPGDKIIGVGQGDQPVVNTMHWPLQRVVQQIRGEKGTKVVLKVIPASDPTETVTRLVDLERDQVKLEEQAAKGRIHTISRADGGDLSLGVITLPTFYANIHVQSRLSPDFRSASYDVENLLNELVDQGAQGIILDLRNDGGGYLPEAVKMTGLFIPSGPTVQVRDGSGVRVLRDRDPRIVYDGPLVILVNRLSASASEIVAGALQDYGRAIIIGDTKTHGKGSVQAVMELGEDESMGSLKVTSALYYRITGSATQLRGVESDIVLPSPYDTMEFGEEFLQNPLEWSMIRSAAFRPYQNLAPVLPLLRARSQQRRNEDEQYQAYEQLLARLEELNQTESLPLHMDQRRAFAKMERELNELQQTILNHVGETDPEEESKADVVLQESLQILSDWVELQDSVEQVSGTEIPPAQRSFSDLVSDWLQIIN